MPHCWKSHVVAQLIEYSWVTIIVVVVGGGGGGVVVKLCTIP